MNKHFVLIFINTVPPYGYGVNNILALPNGFSYTFRYRDKWIAVENPYELRHCDALILLRASPSHVIPLRKANVYKVTKTGPVSFITVRLDKIVEFSSDSDKRKHQQKEFDNHMNSIWQTLENAGHSRKAGVISATDPTYFLKDHEYSGEEKDRTINAWGNILELLGEIDFFSDFDFIRLVEIQSKDGRVAKLVEKNQDIMYVLNNDEIYELKVLQCMPLTSVARMAGQEDGSMRYQERYDRWLELQAPADEIDLLRHRVAIDGRYNVFDLQFHTQQVREPRVSSINLLVKHLRDVSHERLLTEISIPIQVDVPRQQRLYRLGNFFIFMLAGAVFLAPELFERALPMIPFTSPTGGLSLIQRVAVVVAIITSWSFPRAEKWLSNFLGA